MTTIHIEGAKTFTGKIAVHKYDDVLVLTFNNLPDRYIEFEIPWEEWLAMYNKALAR